MTLTFTMLRRWLSIERLQPRYGQYDWAWYETPERHAQIRREAAAVFVADHTRHPERYVAAQLPELPFANDAFDLALCSHLLFTYQQITLEQHIAAIRE
ncbi:MAG TPA: class I SAM-dependent methyltransferase, partial [Arachnia sp.]|nr:class I SAM-dependent methyltransferase [Arachnia sp.]